MPMFPLGTVLFPHALLPLHVFEPRYRLMTAAGAARTTASSVSCSSSAGARWAAATRASTSAPSRAIVRAQELPDGGYALATVGIRRVRVDAVAPRRSVSRRPRSSISTSRRRARDDAAAAGPGAWPRSATCARSTGAPIRGSRSSRPIGDDAEQASYEIAALAPIGPLDAQRVLETEPRRRPARAARRVARRARSRPACRRRLE